MAIFHFLNHSSILIDIEDVKILSDPWFTGTCFEGGWGLRYTNEKAWDQARLATHLWISHFHSDHFHVQTLKKLVEINPDIQVLGNFSYNFQLDDTMRGLGFKNVVSFGEREWLSLSDKVKVSRYPSRGIDNMLFIKTEKVTILNYNDCVLTSWTQRQIKRKIGQIDIVMTNFNHAGKLLLNPLPSAASIKEKLLAAFPTNYEVFDPFVVIPFASHHYYRAKESVSQNESHLESADLVKVDKRVINFNIGDMFEYKGKNEYRLIPTIDNTAVYKNTFEILEHTSTVRLEELKQAAKGYLKNLKSSFPILYFLMPEFRIYIEDLKVLVSFDRSQGLKELSAEEGSHISSHSVSLNKWWTKKYGTDSFIVGAHFQVTAYKRVPLMWQIIFGMLVDNKLDVRSILKMLFTVSGIRFLFNRREEIVGILTSFKLAADYQKQD